LSAGSPAGGAIVHDRELTYSCALAASHPFVREPRKIYTSVHLAVIELLAGYGLSATLRGESLPGLDREFLCFGRGDQDDVVIGPEKILGSAQRRRKGAVLQHGSLVLWRSEAVAAVFPEFAIWPVSIPNRPVCWTSWWNGQVASFRIPRSGEPSRRRNGPAPGSSKPNIGFESQSSGR
jgi:hypothetical protein